VVVTAIIEQLYKMAFEVIARRRLKKRTRPNHNMFIPWLHVC